VLIGSKESDDKIAKVDTYCGTKFNNDEDTMVLLASFGPGFPKRVLFGDLD